jgi:hypothetical protein
VLCSFHVILGIVKAKEVGRVRHGLIKSSSKSSKSEGLLYQASSLSSSLISSKSDEFDKSGGEESSDLLANKSGKLNKLLKVAIIKDTI